MTAERKEGYLKKKKENKKKIERKENFNKGRKRRMD